MTRPSRRNLFSAACCAGAGLAVTSTGVLGFGATVAAAASDPAGRTALNAAQALQLLKSGNAEYLTDAPMRAVSGRARRLEIAQSQSPFAVYVSCSDSRVSPELLFGRGLGELFIVRNAGNTVDTTAMGSIEYAVSQLGVPLIVVMGHERCGAVAAAVSVVQDNVQFPGSIGRMIEPIIPAVLSVRNDGGDIVDNAVRANVRRVVRQLRTASEPMLLDPQRSGLLKVVGAYYDLETGTVDFFDEPES